MGSLWGPWVPLVTILGSLWDRVEVPWAQMEGTLVCFVPIFLDPLSSLWDHLGPPLGLCWGALGLKWQLWQDHTDEKKLPKLYIWINSRSTAQAAVMLLTYFEIFWMNIGI